VRFELGSFDLFNCEWGFEFTQDRCFHCLYLEA
jgi:hypothetical protein